jgi:hypothetical protein
VPATANQRSTNIILPRFAFSNKLPTTACITKAQRVTKPERNRKILLHRKIKCTALLTNIEQQKEDQTKQLYPCAPLFTK